MCADGKSLREAAAAKGKSQPGDEMKNRRETAGLMLEIGRMLCVRDMKVPGSQPTHNKTESPWQLAIDGRACICVCVCVVTLFTALAAESFGTA